MPSRQKKFDLPAVQSLVNAWDRQIRRGQAGETRAALSKLSAGTIPREKLAEVASLARRADLPELALRWLGPVVRAARALTHPATSDELAEYAGSLIKLGATTEALTLLEKVDTGRCPLVHLYRAYAHIAVWDYHSSIADLETFLRRPVTDPYLHFVARVNLISSLTFERRYDEALELISRLLPETVEKKYGLLQGNLLELRAQNEILRKEWKAAEASLNEALRVLSGTGRRFELFAHKWKMIASVLRDGPTPDALADLNRVQNEAIQQKHWETLRDCDRVLALATHNRDLALKLFFGTPYESFREKLRGDWGERLDVPPSYTWAPGSGTGGPEVDVAAFAVSGAENGLRAGGIVHRLLQILCADFYRPQRLACLFAGLYPNEFFNPQSAPLKVHQATIRLRTWFRTNRLPLEIEEEDGFYRLIATGDCKLIVPRPDQSAENPQVALFRRTLGDGRWFKVRDAQSVLKVSPSAALRLIRKLMSEGAIERSGSGNRLRYRFLTSSKL